MKLWRFALLAILVLTFVPGSSVVLSQPAQAPAVVVSPEVHPDRSVTFHFRAPNAKQVAVSIEGQEGPLAMEKDDDGLWSATAPPMEPDYYGYSFLVDGTSVTDPLNPLLKFNLLWMSNMVHIPGPGSLPWELNDIPHGVVHHHFYKSGVVGDQRDYYVYTPPNYDPGAKARYPTLYLLHGFSDDATGWTAVGRAHVILDNLIAEGKAKPMLVVMTLGYGAPEILNRDFSGFRDPSLVNRNLTRFGEALLHEVMPQVEQNYRVSRDRKDRAIAGLSMGGSESLFVGLNHIDHFAWIGAFSTGGLPGDFDKTFPSLDAKANDELKLLWVSCGVDDRLIGANRMFRDWLKGKSIKHEYIETPGSHTWMVWRRNLATLAPLLFR